MTVIDEVIEFYRARLAEDEQIAKAATRGPWSYEVFRRSDVKSEWVLSGTSDPYGVVMGDVGIGWMAGIKGPDPDHIVRHNPARTLKKVAAGRRLIRLYEETCERIDHYVTLGNDAKGSKVAAESYANAILVNASEWDDHEGWKASWQPGWMDEA